MRERRSGGLPRGGARGTHSSMYSPVHISYSMYACRIAPTLRVSGSPVTRETLPAAGAGACRFALILFKQRKLAHSAKSHAGEGPLTGEGPLKLRCFAARYAWGRPGAESAVARLLSKGEGEAVDAAAPYAEYWFGTHPSGPSSLAASGELLASFLARSPAVLGVPPYAGARSPLPYLLKVLSVAKALSVQAHPDRARAAALHAANAREYADANHKPELAVALTPFQAMCGFRPREELARLVAGTPELAALVGPAPLAALRAAAAQAPAEPFRAALRTAFGAYMRAPAADVAAAAAALGERLAAAEAAGELLPPLSPDAVALRLARAFPGDIGVFAPYWLNLLALAPGEAVFLPANEPHAYLAGDAVEVMAASDNVVRAGLTPKFRDVDTLVDMLSYADGAVRVLAPAAGGGEGGAEGGGGPNNSASGGAAVYTYAPPVPEFVLRRLVVPPGGAARVPPGASAATLVVVAGAGALALDGAPDAERAVAVAEGGVWLLRAGRGATLSAPAGAGDALVAFVAAAADAT